MATYLHTYDRKFGYWFPYDEPDLVFQALEDSGWRMVVRNANGTIICVWFSGYKRVSLITTTELPFASCDIWALEVVINDAVGAYEVRPIGKYDSDNRLVAQTPLDAVKEAYIHSET